MGDDRMAIERVRAIIAELESAAHFNEELADHLGLCGMSNDEEIRGYTARLQRQYADRLGQVIG